VQPVASVPAPVVSAPAPTPVDEGESAYASAVALLRDGRNAEAAAAFQAFVITHPQAPQTEDASYLEAVALARAGRIDAAALAAEQHLARFPGSFHRREAEALVARARVSGSR
jgi:TolA-binding protein